MTTIKWTLTRGMWDAIEVGSYRNVSETDYPTIREFSKLLHDKIAAGQTYEVKYVGLNTVWVTWSDAQ